VCGTDIAEGWFVHFSASKTTRYLCSAACALTFFDSARPPAHDHKARHEYNRVRAAIVQAARDAELAADGNSTAAINGHEARHAS